MKSLEKKKKSSTKKKEKIKASAVDSYKDPAGSKLKKKDKKRKSENSFEGFSEAISPKKFKMNEKSSEQTENPLKIFQESKDLKKKKKKSKKSKKSEDLHDEFHKLLFKQKAMNMEHHDKILEESEKNGKEHFPSKKSKKKKNKNKESDKSLDSTIESASTNDLSLDSLNKKKEKLLQQLEECNESLESVSELKKKKKKNKKENKKKKLDAQTTESTEELNKSNSLGSESDSITLKKPDPDKKIILNTKNKHKANSKKKSISECKKEHRNELRKEEGQYFFINTLSIVGMQAKIAEIEARPEKSNRALRILRTLKKKLKVAQEEESKPKDDVQNTNMEVEKLMDNLNVKPSSSKKIDNSMTFNSKSVKNNLSNDHLFSEDSIGDLDITESESIVNPEKIIPKSESFVKQENKNEAKVEKKQRYVLFIGNLSYDTTTVDLKKHFLKKVSKVSDVRIPLNKETQSPKGIAFIEVENSTDFEKALSLHGTFLRNRPIKVEFTTGSKKQDKQLLIHKNMKLSAMRKAGMLAGSTKVSQKRSFRRNTFKNQPQTQD